MRQFLLLFPVALILVVAVGCTSSTSSSPGASSAALTSSDGKYVILDTRTDQFDFNKAKSLAEDAIAKYPKLKCMVGLFAYNPPKCLEAVKEADKLDQIQLVGFDEEGPTLQGIADGEVHGTVVQNPYRYGYESVRILAGLARGDESVLPEGGFLNIPARKITKDNVAEFRAELDRLTAPAADARAAAATDAKRPRVAFVTNGIASFWVIAEKGARDAAREFDVDVDVRMPPKGVEDQTRMVQDLLTRGVDGIAISPIDPDNQGDLLKEIAQKTKLITHDSDAPNSERICYVGMDNYAAGRMCGELVREALPDGGEIMIFVGRLEQLNAKLRQQGTIDAVLERERSIEQ